MSWEDTLALAESRRLFVREWVHFDNVFSNGGGRRGTGCGNQAMSFFQKQKSAICDGRPAVAHGNRQDRHQDLCFCQGRRCPSGSKKASNVSNIHLGGGGAFLWEAGR